MIDSHTTLSDADQLRFTDEQFVWRFSPNQTDPKLLEAIFVGREPLLQNVLEKIAESATTGATHHVLIYGPRGIGKSHFIALLHHRITTDETLSESVHLAWLSEDETTTSMVQLLVRIYRSLCTWYPHEYSAKWLDELLDFSPEEIADSLTRRLVARFAKRKLVILVENLNLLLDNLGTGGQHQLRAMLQESPFACLIATSQQLSRAMTDRSEPFFGFFQQIPLKPLTLENAQQLLVRISETKGQVDLVRFLNTPDGRGRIRAIHDLAGGNHRVYIVLSGFVTRESLDELVAPFQKMADDLTPYYQERLRWISPLPRQIVELLCRTTGTLNPKEIARRLLVDQRSIGKQVRILEEIGYLTSTKRGRETYYDLSEPLMRLAYEVKEQSLLRMLIEFLRIWYRPDEMQELRKAGLSPSTLAYVDAAWEHSQTYPDPRLKLTQTELERAESEGRSHELATLWEEKAVASHVARDWLLAGYYFGKINNEHAKAIDCCDKAIELDPQDAHPWNNKGLSLAALDRHEEALRCYDKAIELDLQYANARINRSASLFALQRWEDGFKSVRDALMQSHLGTLGDVCSMFSLIFRLSEDSAQLQTRINILVNLYQHTAEEHGFALRPKVDPLSYLADGLVKSLARIDTNRVTPTTLENYVAAVEKRVADLREFEIPLRLFRYGIRYLISGKESEFVELIEPERRILRQALGLSEEW
jgi:tetratricopeptide (TPR) repeat protein